MVDFSHRPILQQGPAMFSWRIPHALTWSFGFCGQRPGWIQLSLGLVFLGHSLWENLASLPPSGYWCGHRKYGFGNGAHVSFDGDENAFGAQPHDPRLFGSDLYLAFPWALCFGQPLPRPGHFNMHSPKGLRGWLLRAGGGPVFKSSFPLQGRIPVQ